MSDEKACYNNYRNNHYGVFNNYWRDWGVLSTVRSTSQIFREVPQFWDMYESKPRSYYEEFSQACDRILEAYSEYTNYPLYIPIENNPVISEIILSSEPKLITLWSSTHISITLVHIGEGTGFHITWKKDWESNTWNFFSEAKHVMALLSIQEKLSNKIKY